ncbi:hypothetical protein C8R46DRAFT_320120 [Mycena filopes]|nr:hypothetical protein C8R46DRAFT_320120 [Mycena filopes]
MDSRERPRAHSVMQMRPTQSAFHVSSPASSPPNTPFEQGECTQVRASKLFQKVSAKFAPRGGPNDAAGGMGNSPYMRGTYSMDGAAITTKPYMSQPMLGLALTRTMEDTAESDGSASPARSDGSPPAAAPPPAPPPAATARPPHPSRAPPPAPYSSTSAPNTPNTTTNTLSNTTNPARRQLTLAPVPVTLNLTPATPTSPTAGSHASHPAALRPGSSANASPSSATPATL